jgi:predicted transglutaminase-like cysteine proteinase
VDGGVMRKAALLGFGFWMAAVAGASAQSSVPITSAALATGETLPPIGWVQFCGENPADCQVAVLPARVAKLDSRAWRELVRINREVNDAVEATSDLDHWGALEKWSYPTDGKGDCEDYALEKRKRLMEAGWPRQALLITVVRDKKGDGHAILTVRTDRGDFVLDNQESRVKGWADTGYDFVKRQSEEHPSRWVSLGGAGNGILTANR